MTRNEANAKVRDLEYLAEIKRRMKDDPIGRANVAPEIVSALIDALETARESNRHNFAAAQAAQAALKEKTVYSEERVVLVDGWPWLQPGPSAS